MDSQDGDQGKKEDFYSKGRTTDWDDFKQPPPRIIEEQQQMLHHFRRIMECNRGAFGTQRLRHAYLYDGKTGKSIGKGNPKTKEKGPLTDDCYWLPGTEEQQVDAFQDLKHSVKTEENQRKGLPGYPGRRSWAPGTQDCHTMKDHSARKHGIPSYTSRIGESNTRPKVTREEWEDAWKEMCMHDGEIDELCKPFSKMWPKDDDFPPTSGGQSNKV